MIHEKQVSALVQATLKQRSSEHFDNALAALDSTIRNETVVTMRARVRYTRVVRELRRLEREYAAKGSISCAPLNQQYLLERRVSRHLSYLEHQLGRTLAQRQRLKSVAKPSAYNGMKELQTADD
ncbi:MAG: hypothetical protein AB8B86_00560 [Pseudomonadales bacterium]